MTNRDRPASTFTKRETLALRLYVDRSIDLSAAEVVALVDALFDELDTPAELRDEPDVVCTEIKWGRVRP